MDTSQSEGVDAPVVQMQLQLTGESDIATTVPLSETKKPKSLTFEMSMDKFRAMYGELKTAARIMAYDPSTSGSAEVAALPVLARI